jgi:hypothetical protein
MKTPTIFQWYQILRRRYKFTVFQAVRSALWLVRTPAQIDDEMLDSTNDLYASQGEATLVGVLGENKSLPGQSVRKAV